MLGAKILRRRKWALVTLIVVESVTLFGFGLQLLAGLFPALGFSPTLVGPGHRGRVARRADRHVCPSARGSAGRRRYRSRFWSPRTDPYTGRRGHVMNPIGLSSSASPRTTPRR